MIGPSRIAIVVVLAFAGLVAGFVVQRALTPAPVDHAVRVSVVALPASPSPSPSPTPTVAPRTSIHIGGRGGGSSGGVSNCPAGCQCQVQPPSGIVILCH